MEEDVACLEDCFIFTVGGNGCAKVRLQQASPHSLNGPSSR